MGESCKKQKKTDTTELKTIVGLIYNYYCFRIHAY